MVGPDDSNDVAEADSSIKALARSPFFRRSLLSSLLFDQNPELFLLQLRLLTYVVPFAPVELTTSEEPDSKTDAAPKDCLLPKLLVIIARAVCWFAPLSQPLRRTRKAEGGYFDRYTPRPGNARHRSSTGIAGSEASGIAIGGSNYRRRDRIGVTETSGSMDRHTPPREQSGDGLEGYMAFRKRQEEEQARQRANVPFATSSSYGEGPSVSPETDLTQGDVISSGSFHLPPHPSQSWKTLTGSVQLDLNAYLHLRELLCPQDAHGHSETLDDLVTTVVRDVYGYWPGNLFAFARDPTEYLTVRGEVCIFAATEGWKSVFADRAELVARLTVSRAKAEKRPAVNSLVGLQHAMRNLTVNPLLLLWTPKEELTNVNRFGKVDLTELVATSHRLLSRTDNGFGASLMADRPPIEVRPSASTSPDDSSSVGPMGKDATIRSDQRAREGNSSPINILNRSMAAFNLSGPSSSADRMRREQVMLATELTHTKRLARLYLSRKSD